MTYGLLIWRSVCQKALQSMISIGVVAVAAALALTVLLLSGSVRHGLQGAVEPFDLIVGAKGSPNQLVFNTVFLKDAPIGNIDAAVVQRLRDNPAVLSAISLGFGDTYQHWRIIGAEPEIFRYSAKAGGVPWLKLKEGRSFEKPFEAVIGEEVALRSGLKVGDQFSSSHGVVAASALPAHAETFTVVGILNALAGPYDGAVLIALSDLRQMHGDGAQRGVTAVLVKPRGYAEALDLYRQFQQEKDAQMVFPSQVVAQMILWLGDAETALRAVGGATALMAILIVGLSLYWSSLSRARDRAVLRAIGAARRDIALLLFGEGAFLVISGTALGVLLGMGIFKLIAGALAKKTLLDMTLSFGAFEGAMLAAIVIAGLVAGSIPAFCEAKREIADDL